MDEQDSFSTELTSSQIDQYLYALSLKAGKVELSYESYSQWHGKISLSADWKEIIIEQRATWLPDLLRGFEKKMREHGIVVMQNFLLEDWQKSQDVRRAKAQLAQAQKALAADNSVPFLNLGSGSSLVSTGGSK